MKIKAQTLRILVVNFGTPESPWNLFCGIDEKRLVFFQYLSVGNLPAYHTDHDTQIRAYRNNNLHASGTAYLSSGHVNDFIFRENHNMKLNSKDQLIAFDFNEDDIIEVEKYDWDAEDNPLSLISTRRSVGNNFHLVFHRDDIAKKIVDFSGMTYEELSEKSVIFENKPGESGRYISHF